MVKRLQKYAKRWWYPLLVGALAGIDALIVVIPTDAILLSSVVLAPRRWFVLALCVASGSTLGGTILSALVKTNGLPWILEFYPHIDQTQTWITTHRFFDQYGAFLVFGVSMTPFAQQPSIILASLAMMPYPILIPALFAGRALKYVFVSYAASHAPKFFKNRWGLGQDP